MKDANIPTHIQVRGARVHNLKNIDVDIPPTLPVFLRPIRHPVSLRTRGS